MRSRVHDRQCEKEDCLLCTGGGGKCELEGVVCRTSCLECEEFYTGKQVEHCWSDSESTEQKTDKTISAKDHEVGYLLKDQQELPKKSSDCRLMRAQ